MGRLAEKLGVQNESTFSGGGRLSQKLSQVNKTTQIPKDRNALANFGIGALKGLGSTANSLGKIGGMLGGNLINRGLDKVLGQKTESTNLVDPELVKPQGTAQKAGFVTEQIAEFVVPMSKVAKVEKAIDIAVNGSKILQGSRFAQGAVKVGAKALTEAGVGGALTFAQTADLNEAKKSALLFGGTRAVTGIAGQTLRAFGVPEKLYTKILKNNYKDMVSELRDKGIQTFAKTHPEQYQEFLKNGIIKTGLGGKKVINESLAKQALDRGLKGSLRNMSDKVVEDTVILEDSARKAVKGSSKIIEFKNADRLAGVLEETAQRYSNVGNGSVARTAQKFAIKLANGSKLTAEESLRLRRFLDGMRIRSSFDASPSLSLSQQNFKYWADITRSKLSSVPGLQKIMRDYAFNIEALDALAREASRRGNNQVISLIDSIFLGASAVGEPATAVSIGTARKLLTDPRTLTSLGSVIEKTGNITKPGALIKSGINQLLRD